MYLLDRPAQGLPFLHDYFPLIPDVPPLMSRIGQVFPAFAHTLGFTLLTAGLLALERVGIIVAGASWGLVNMAFEFGQHSSVAPSIVRYFEKLSGDSKFVNLLRMFFQHGTFDLFDVIAILAGASFGYVIALILLEK